VLCQRFVYYNMQWYVGSPHRSFWLDPLPSRASLSPSSAPAVGAKVGGKGHDLLDKVRSVATLRGGFAVVSFFYWPTMVARGRSISSPQVLLPEGSASSSSTTARWWHLCPHDLLPIWPRFFNHHCEGSATLLLELDASLSSSGTSPEIWR
jgi:hypothetical protein